MGAPAGRRLLKGLLWTAVLLLLLAGMVWRWMFYTPGSSFAGAVQVNNADPLPRELEKYVATLAGDIGPRGTYDPPSLQRTSTYLQDQFRWQVARSHLRGWRPLRHCPGHRRGE